MELRFPESFIYKRRGVPLRFSGHPSSCYSLSVIKYLFYILNFILGIRFLLCGMKSIDIGFNQLPLGSVDFIHHMLYNFKINSLFALLSNDFLKYISF